MFLAFAMVLGVASAWAQAAKFPELTGRVVDTANLLSPGMETALSAKLSAHETKSGQQVVVATIPSLGGGEIDGYANQLFRHWALGDKALNDGVLFLVAKDDRKLRIEVGYGVEGVLTDALSAYIIRSAILPAFKKGDFGRGIVSGTDQILAVLSSDKAELEAWRGRSKTKSRDKVDWPVLLFFAVWVIILIGIPLLNAMIRRFGTKIAPNHYRWLGMEARPPKKRAASHNGGWTTGGTFGGGGWSSGGGGFGGGGGSSGGGGASGGW